MHIHIYIYVYMRVYIRVHLYSVKKGKTCTVSQLCGIALLPSAPILLCLKGAIFCKQYLVTRNFRHIEIMFVYMNMFSMCLNNGAVRSCLKIKMTSFKHSKTDALLGDSTQSVVLTAE